MCSISERFTKRGGEAVTLQPFFSIETISEEQQINNGLIYAFIAFLITWIGFFFYRYDLSKKRKQLENEINSVKEKLTSK